MTDTVGPFDDNAWAQAEWFDHMPTALPSGVIGSPASATSSGSLPFSASGLSVSIGDGAANVGGAGFKRAGGGPAVTVTANTNASLSRRDRVVLRRDIAANTILPVVIPGTASSSPTAPAIQRTATLFDLPLFSFLVPPSSGTTLTSVVDERPWVDPNGYRGVSVYAAAARLALTAGGDLNPGAHAYETSTKRDYVWDGTGWSYRPTGSYAKVLGTSTQSIPANVSAHTAITLNTVERSDGVTTGSGRLTAVTWGLYLVSGGVNYVNGSGANARFIASLMKNGTLIPESQNRCDPAVNNTITIATAAVLLELNVGDYVQLSTRQDTSGAQDVDRAQCFLQAHLVSPL